MASEIDITGMLPILGWIIHYGNGSLFTSGDGAWADAPDQDVQIVELLHETPYRDLVTGLDEYLLPGETAVKYGGQMNNADFEALIAAVVTNA